MDTVETYVWITADDNGIYATLDKDGLVSFVVQARSTSAIRGTEFFRRMMEAFGERARAIRGVWRKSTIGQESTNIDRVNELTARGMPLKDAITQTWTATRATKFGFRRVQLVGPPEGVSGAYTAIDVIIEK